MTDEAPNLRDLRKLLSPKELKFVELLAGDCHGNATEAARRAGYKGTRVALASHAHTLRRRPRVKAVLEAMVEADPAVPGRIERLRLLGQVARGELSEWRMTSRGQVVELPTSPQARMEAIKALGDLAGDYVTKVAQTNAAGEDVKTLSIAELMALAAGTGEE